MTNRNLLINQTSNELYYYTDFNNIDPMKELKKKYKNRITFLEKFLIDNHYEKLFDTFKIFFITSNPILNVDHNKEYIKLISKQYDKQFISGSLFNFEINTKEKLHSVPRGVSLETRSVAGVQKSDLRLHSHGLIFINQRIHSKNMTKNQMITHYYIPKIMGSKQSVDVKQIYNHEGLVNRVRYILGIKTKEYKIQNSKDDRKWRKTIGIKDYYFKVPNFKRNPKRLVMRDRDKEEKLEIHLQSLIERLKLECDFIFSV